VIRLWFGVHAATAVLSDRQDGHVDASSEPSIVTYRLCDHTRTFLVRFIQANSRDMGLLFSVHATLLSGVLVLNSSMP
jgi:hypothetical protein